MPVASSASTLGSATFEKRGTHTARPATRRAGESVNHSTSSPTRPADPDRSGSQMQPVEEQRQPARGGLPGVAGRSGDRRAPRRRASTAPVTDTRATIGRRRRSGRSSHSVIHDAMQNSPKHSDHVDIGAAERGDPEQRHERPDVEHRPQRVDRGREVEVDGDRDQPDHRGDHERDRQRPQVGLGDAAHQRPRDEHPQHEQPDRHHHRQEHHPARDQHVG